MTLEVSLLEDLKNGHSKRCYNLLLYTKRGKATEKMSQKVGRLYIIRLAVSLETTVKARTFVLPLEALAKFVS